VLAAARRKESPRRAFFDEGRNRARWLEALCEEELEEVVGAGKGGEGG